MARIIDGIANALMAATLLAMVTIARTVLGDMDESGERRNAP